MALKVDEKCQIEKFQERGHETKYKTIPQMKPCFLILILVLIAVGSSAQTQQIRFKRISIEDGLSQSTVKAILKDREGFMWLGTRDGLNRYDGNKIVIYRHDSKNPASISSSSINDILEDKAGNLWICTVRGIDRFDRQNETFIHYPLKEDNTHVFDIHEDHKGNLWLGAIDGVHKFDFQGNRFTFLSKQPDTPDKVIFKVTEDNQGYIWMSSIWIAARFDPRTQSYKNFRNDPGNPKSLSYGFQPRVYLDKAGRIWIGTVGGGLNLYNPKDDSFTRFLHDEDNPNSLCHNEVLSVEEGPDGRLWVGTQNGGISVFDYEKNIFTTLRQDVNDLATLSNNSIHALHKDDLDNMWVGTWAGGLSLFPRHANKFTLYNRVLDFKNPNIYEITGDSEGNTWIGVEDGGLVSYDRHSGKFKYHPNQHANEFMTTVPLSVVEYNKDTLAITYHVGSFAFFDKRTGLFTHFFGESGNPRNPNPNPAIPGNLVGHSKPVLIKDHKNNLWLGDWGNGLNFYDRRTKRFTNYNDVPDDTLSLNGSAVFALLEDSERNVWIGTDKGLNRFDSIKHHFVRYEKDASLNNTPVYSILEDSNGKLWIGTSGEGLVSLNKETGQFIRYPALDDLPNNVINGIVEDDNGNLWLGTNKGISRFDPAGNTLRNYDVRDGLQGNEFNRNACYKAPDGTLFFAGVGGFNIFHPDSISDNPHLPPVVITDFQLFNKSVAAAPNGSVLKEAINQTKEITLSYAHSVFSFEFAALDFTTPTKNMYAYKMEGFDKDWNYVGNKHTATYTNLDPGEYVFKVKASNNDGVWNEQGTSLVIHVLPPWWKTWWFRAAAMMMIIGLAGGFYQFRLRTIKRQNKKLEKSVLIRTKELQLANEEIKEINKELVHREEEIQTQNEELSMQNDELTSQREEIASQRDLLADQNQKLNKASKTIEEHNQILDQQVKERTKELVAYNQQFEQFAFIAAHNLRGPVARILGLGQIMELSKDKPDDEKMLFNKLILTTQELDRVVRDINTILEIRKSSELLFSEINLTEELDTIKANLINEIAETKAEIRADFSAIDTIHSVKPYVDSILVNLISNAIKYRQPNLAPCIQLRTEIHNGYICLMIRDNGLGIDLEKYQKQLFNLYKRFHSHVDGKGIGLYLVKTQVEALGGKIEVESEVNIGSTFKVFLKDCIVTSKSN